MGDEGGAELSAVADERIGLPCSECGGVLWRVTLHGFTTCAQVGRRTPRIPLGTGCARRVF